MKWNYETWFVAVSWLVAPSCEKFMVGVVVLVRTGGVVPAWCLSRLHMPEWGLPMIAEAQGLHYLHIKVPMK